MFWKRPSPRKAANHSLSPTQFEAKWTHSSSGFHLLEFLVEIQVRALDSLTKPEYMPQFNRGCHHFWGKHMLVSQTESTPCVWWLGLRPRSASTQTESEGWQFFFPLHRIPRQKEVTTLWIWKWSLPPFYRHWPEFGWETSSMYCAKDLALWLLLAQWKLDQCQMCVWYHIWYLFHITINHQCPTWVRDIIQF